MRNYALRVPFRDICWRSLSRVRATCQVKTAREQDKEKDIPEKVDHTLRMPIISSP